MRQTTGFARMPDGERIAYAAVGSGPGVVLPAWWVSHVVEDWHIEPLRRFVEGLAAGRMVVRYDRLGTGVSDRERPPETFTPEFEVATLRAVLDALGLERVTVMGISCGGCTSASFAASYPERVERLVLYGSYADGHALGSPGARRGMVDLVRSHWGLGSRPLADVFGPSWSLEDRAVFTAVQRASADAEVAAALLEVIYETDVREDLPRVQAPALVVHREQDRAMRLRCAREVAALLPDAELVTLRGDAHLPWHGDGGAVVRAVAPFLGIDAAVDPPGAPDADGLGELSTREWEVLGLVAQGLSDPQIAERLVISPHTVHRHVANVLAKLRLPTRAAAAHSRGPHRTALTVCRQSRWPGPAIVQWLVRSMPPGRWSAALRVDSHTHRRERNVCHHSRDPRAEGRPPGKLSGVFLPSQRRFQIAIPRAVDPGSGQVQAAQEDPYELALTNTKLYLGVVNDQQIFTTAIPTLPH